MRRVFGALLGLLVGYPIFAFAGYWAIALFSSNGFDRSVGSQHDRHIRDWANRRRRRVDCRIHRGRKDCKIQADIADGQRRSITPVESF
jgi:hypothetical protein